MGHPIDSIFRYSHHNFNITPKNMRRINKKCSKKPKLVEAGDKSKRPRKKS